MKTFKQAVVEAAEHGVTVAKIDHRKRFNTLPGARLPLYIRFEDSEGNALSWMTKDMDEYVGFTCAPEVTGRKRGSKGEVADWCLEWAVNGFY